MTTPTNPKLTARYRAQAAEALAMARSSINWCICVFKVYGVSQGNMRCPYSIEAVNRLLIAREARIAAGRVLPD